MIKVKICGLQEERHIVAAAEGGADMIGFVFAPSRRRVDYQKAYELGKDLPRGLQKVGVFVNPSLEDVRRAVEVSGIDLIQLHGQETAEFAKNLPKPVIKAFPITQGVLPSSVSTFREEILLLDAPPAEFEGGSGETFDWEKTDLTRIVKQKIIIAGGLTPANVQRAIDYFQPYGVDVSSGVETNGIKDSKKIKSFIENAKGASR